MALATRCPACHSVFRVVADQLKLRGGLVRCGQCHTVFDAINALTYLDDTQLRRALGAAPAPAPAPSAPAPVATAQDAADAAPPDRRSPDFLIEPEPAPATTEAQAGDASPAPHGAASPLPERAAAAMRELAAALDLVPALSLSPSSPLPTHTRIEATASTAAALGQEAPAENEAATTDAKFEPEDSAASGSAEIAEPPSSPTMATAAEFQPVAASEAQESASATLAVDPNTAPDSEPKVEAELGPDSTVLPSAPPPPAQEAAQAAVPATLAEPEFLRRAAQQEKERSRSRWWAAASLAAALVLAVQLLIAFRAEILMRWPQAQPLLVELCEQAGCTVDWPAQPDQIAVLAGDLQALPGSAALELNVTLRNRAPYPQALPALEITLTDARNQALARRVVLPADYLPAGRADRLAPGEDLAARLFFEVKGPAPTGFLVYPFHL